MIIYVSVLAMSDIIIIIIQRRYFLFQRVYAMQKINSVLGLPGLMLAFDQSIYAAMLNYSCM
jgi:hypothetical protein